MATVYDENLDRLEQLWGEDEAFCHIIHRIGRVGNIGEFMCGTGSGPLHVPTVMHRRGEKNCKACGKPICPDCINAAYGQTRPV